LCRGLRRRHSEQRSGRQKSDPHRHLPW
jgi:hypothetical protein